LQVLLLSIEIFRNSNNLNFLAIGGIIFAKYAGIRKYTLDNINANNKFKSITPSLNILAKILKRIIASK